jgi:hypothetical protein
MKRSSLVLGFGVILTTACSSSVGDEWGGDSEPETAGAEPTMASTAALVAGNRLFGYVATAPGADFNRCVTDAGNVLRRLNARGDLMGFHYSLPGYTGLSGSDWHSQAIVRLPFYEWDWLLRGQFFASSFSHPMGTGPHYDSHLGVAQLGFKGGKEGKRLGSNRTYNDNWNGNTADWYVTPHPADTFIPMAGSPQFKIDEIQNHPGGMAGLGWHVVVALQQFTFDDGAIGGSTPVTSQPYVKIYDLWDPSWPVLRATFLTKNNGWGWGGTHFVGTDNMAAALTKLADGRFLLAVIKATPLGQVEFYVSSATDLGAPGLFGADNRAPDAIVAQNPGWQNMNFLTDCNGDLYLMGFRGDDYIDLWKVDLYGGGTPPDPAYRIDTNGLTSPSRLNTKQMYCSDNHNVDQCEMTAAAGSYVDPNGHVVVYALSSANDGGATSFVHGNGTPWLGVEPAHGGYLRGVEFHERHGNWGAGTTCPTLADAWVEFYEHPAFNSSGGNAGQYYRVDYPERDAKNGKQMGTNFFNDKASSIRWCIPVGHSFIMYRDSWSGPYQYLNGTGDVRHLTTLVGRSYGSGGGSMDNTVTSYHFHENFTGGSGAISGDWEAGY